MVAAVQQQAQDEPNHQQQQQQTVARENFLNRMIHDHRDNASSYVTTYYDRYANEFTTFANHFHDNATVNEKKLYHFLMYTAYRKKRPSTPGFSMDADSLIADVLATEEKFSHHGDMDSDTWEQTHLQIVAENPDYEPCGISQFNKYRGGLKGLAELQNPTLNADELFKSGRIKKLTRTVRNRKAKINRRLLKEVPLEKVIPFKTLPHIPEIEEKFWDRSKRTPAWKKIMAGLRNRFFFLWTITAIIRGEALWKARLCDFVSVVFQSKADPSAYEIMAQIIDDGKTNDGSDVQLGRALRHLDPFMCPIGAIGFYLLARFMLTDEDEHFDYTDNSSWFNAALLVGEHVTRNSNTTVVGTRMYSTTVSEILNELGLPEAKKIHFGRSEGPALLEVQELDSDQIRQLGNWKKDVFQSVYSQGFPLAALRGSAGFDVGKGLHLNPRTSLEVPYQEELYGLFFQHVETHLEGLSDQRSTARYHLEFLKSLRRVVVQDAAHMIVNGRSHPLFDMHPGFQTALFRQRYVEDMRQHLQNMETHPTTIQQQINTVLPQVGHQFHALHQVMLQNYQNTTNQLVSINGQLAFFGTQHQQQQAWHHEQRQMHAQQRHWHIEQMQLFQMQANNMANAAGASLRRTYQTSEDSPPPAILPTITPAARPRQPTMPQQHEQTPNNSPLPPVPTVQVPATAEHHPLLDDDLQEQLEDDTDPPPVAANEEQLQTQTINIPPLRPTYQSTTQVIQDWFGYAPSPFESFGGLLGLENTNIRGQQTWRQRQGYTSAQSKQFGRIRKVARCVAVRTCIDTDREFTNSNVFDLDFMQEDLMAGAASLMEHIVSKKRVPNSGAEPNITLRGMEVALEGFL